MMSIAHKMQYQQIDEELSSAQSVYEEAVIIDEEFDSNKVTVIQ